MAQGDEYSLLRVRVEDGPLEGHTLLMPVVGDVDGELLEMVGGPADGAELYLPPAHPMSDTKKFLLEAWDYPGLAHRYERRGKKLQYEGAMGVKPEAVAANRRRQGGRRKR